MKIQHKEDPRPLRAKAYPPMGDQLDALMKLAVALKASGFSLPRETEEWLDACIAVKNKYKKAE